MVAGEGGGQAGMGPLDDFARSWEIKKLLAGVIARGDVLGFDGSNLAITATTSQDNIFFVARAARGNGDATVPVFMPGEIALVTVAAAGAATLHGALKIGGVNGQVTDQGASTNLSKVVGWCLGKYDVTNKTLLMANGAAGDVVMMLIRQPTAVTTA